MEVHIVEDIIIPEVPKVVPGEQLYMYVPIATFKTAGIASYDSAYFSIYEGKVSLNVLFVNSLQRKTDNTLNTTAKTVVGAINEIDARIEQIIELGALSIVTVDGAPVQVFDADTKVDVTEFDEFKSQVEAVLDQSEILTVDEIKSQYNEQETGNGANVLNGSVVDVLSVAGDTIRVENLAKPYAFSISENNSQYIEGESVGYEINVTAIALITRDGAFANIKEITLSKGRYLLKGAPKTTDNQCFLVVALPKDEVEEEPRDYGEGVVFEVKNDGVSCQVFIGIRNTATLNVTYTFKPALINLTATPSTVEDGTLLNSYFSGIKSESKNLVYPFELVPVSAVRDYADATVNNNTITVDVHTRLDLTSTTNIQYFAVKRGLNLTQGRYIITGSPQSSIDSVSLHIEYSEGVQYKSADDVGNGVEIAIARDSTATLYIRLGNNTEIGEYVFTPALRKLALDGSYEDVWNFPKIELPIGTTLNLITRQKTNTFAEYTFTGLETWNFPSSNAPTGFKRVYVAVSDTVLPNMDTTKPAYFTIACDRFPAYINLINPSAVFADLTLTETTVVSSIPNASGCFVLAIKEEDGVTIDLAFVQNLTRGMTVRYAVTSPNYTSEDITPEQANAGNSYQAYYEGTESVLGNDSAEAGGENTITAEYVVVNKVGE